MHKAVKFGGPILALGFIINANKPLIYTGENAKGFEAPWRVAVIDNDYSNTVDAYRGVGCGGVLINNSWVLTAAH